jgi:uncharacterized protein YxeA
MFKWEQLEHTKRGNQKPYIKEGNTTQRRSEKSQKDKQWPIKHYTEN